MNDAGYRSATIDWYRDRLGKENEDVRILSSGNTARREMRFEVLRSAGIEPGCSILDLGCGFADFYAHLRDEGVDVSYTGVDVVPEFVERARARFPEITAQVRDVLDDPFPDGTFDFVVASQVLNLRFPDSQNLPLAKRMLTAMFRMAKRGIACDFVTDHVDFQEPYLHYYNPEAMFSFAKTLSKRVVLRHDYPLYEFCLYIYPDFQGWSGAKQ